MKKTKITMPLFVILLSIGIQSYSQQNSNEPAKPLTSGYAPVNGLKMYYEIYGEGKPIVLLHGAFNTINLNWAMLIPELSKKRQVIAVEFQGHGRTADIDRPFSFENFADDVAGVLKHLKIDSADIMGFSMGGGVAWQMAIRHPQLVKKLIIASTPYKYDGWSPETKVVFPKLAPEFFEGTPVKTAYDSLAPGTKNFPALVNKMKQLVSKPYDFGAEKIKAIKSPTLIISADGDGVLPEHAVEMFRLRHGSYMVDFGPVPATQLAIFPGTSHISVMFHPEWLLSIINPFLDAAFVSKN